MRLDLKLILATISGLLCVEIFSLSSWLGQLGGEWLEGLAFYVVSGVVFAVAVLWPYLTRTTVFPWRGPALIAASALSYWCALWVVFYSSRGDFMAVPQMPDYIAASVTGAGLVFLACKVIVPFQWSIRYVVLGLVSGIAGGWLFPTFMQSPHFDERASFIVWQCIVCLALHFGALQSLKIKAS